MVARTAGSDAISAEIPEARKGIYLRSRRLGPTQSGGTKSYNLGIGSV